MKHKKTRRELWTWVLRSEKLQLPSGFIVSFLLDVNTGLYSSLIKPVSKLQRVFWSSTNLNCSGETSCDFKIPPHFSNIQVNSSLKEHQQDRNLDSILIVLAWGFSLARTLTNCIASSDFLVKYFWIKHHCLVSGRKWNKTKQQRNIPPSILGE